MTVDRKKITKDISVKAKDALQTTVEAFEHSALFLNESIGRDFVGMEVYEMAEPFSRSTLTNISVKDIDVLTKGTNDSSEKGFIEIIMEVKSIPENDSLAEESSQTGDEAKIVAVNNAGLIARAKEEGIDMIPVKMTWRGPQSIYGSGVWSITSSEDLPTNIRSLDGNSFMLMPEPAVTTENIVLDPRDASSIGEALDAILSVANMTPRMSSGTVGDSAYKWAVKSEDAGKYIMGMTDQEIFDKAIRYAIKPTQEQMIGKLHSLLGC